MTITAGFVCANGIILCADSQHSDEQAKYQRDKIYSNEDETLCVTGAGNEAYIRMTFDKLCEEFTISPMDRMDARKKVEDIVKGVYNEHIFKLWKPTDPTCPEMALIVAAKCDDGEQALLKTSLSAVYLEDSYASVGSGQPMLEYWAAYLYRSTLSMDALAFPVLLMFREAKKSSEFCGGYTLMRKIPTKVSKEQTRSIYRIFDEGWVIAAFPEAMTRIISVVNDPNVSDEWIKTKLDEFSSHIMSYRKSAIPTMKSD